MLKASRLPRDIGRGCPSGTKLASLDGLGGVWMLAAALVEGGVVLESGTCVSGAGG